MSLTVIRSEDVVEARTLEPRDTLALRVTGTVVWPYPAREGDVIVIHPLIGTASRWVSDGAGSGAFAHDRRDFEHAREAWHAIFLLIASGAVVPSRAQDADQLLEWRIEFDL